MRVFTYFNLASTYRIGKGDARGWRYGAEHRRSAGRDRRTVRDWSAFIPRVCRDEAGGHKKPEEGGVWYGLSHVSSFLFNLYILLIWVDSSLNKSRWGTGLDSRTRSTHSPDNFRPTIPFPRLISHGDLLCQPSHTTPLSGLMHSFSQWLQTRIRVNLSPLSNSRSIHSQTTSRGPWRLAPEERRHLTRWDWPDQVSICQLWVHPHDG